jgi:cyclohexanecarboxylate-CoA ligase
MLYETLLTGELADQYRARGWWPDRLLNDAVADWSRQQPQKTAVIDARGRLSYQELRQQADACALALLERGVRRGDAVLVQLPNWHEFVVATLAIERIGAVITPVAPIFRQRELRAMLRLARPVAAVFPTQFRNWDYAAMFAELQAETPALHSLIAIDGEERDEGLVPWPALLRRGAALAAHRPMLDWLRPHPDDIAELMFTSGTTGEPKGVLHTANTLGSAAAATIRGHRLTGEDVFHMVSTLGHQIGFVYGVRIPLLVGATMVYQEAWDPEAFIRLVEAEQVTFTMAATPFLADTVRACRASGRGLASLRTYICAGAPIPKPLADEVAAHLSCRLVPGWGMTENDLVTSVLPDDPPEKAVSTDGRPFPEMEVSVRDEAGAELAPGQEGDLYARGAFMFVGYVQGRRFSEQFFTSDGWFNTGDRARRDADGYIRISGRTKDIIIRGGENIPVKEIEDLLLRHPKVRSVVLVGLPDARLGEVGCACVIPETGETVTLEELRELLTEQQVTRQFWPERLALLTEFPLTPSGKVQKFRLRDLLTAG